MHTTLTNNESSKGGIDTDSCSGGKDTKAGSRARRRLLHTTTQMSWNTSSSTWIVVGWSKSPAKFPLTMRKMALSPNLQPSALLYLLHNRPLTADEAEPLGTGSGAAILLDGGVTAGPTFIIWATAL